MFTQACDTPIGQILVCADAEAILSIRVPADPVPEAPCPLTERAVAQIVEYFSGHRRVFDLPLRLSGTPFQQAVYRALLEVPFGETTTYGRLAAKAGFPGAARAVGAAMKRNPLLLAVPCHRVLASNGPGGFSCGLEKKIILLRLEGHIFP